MNLEREAEEQRLQNEVLRRKVLEYEETIQRRNKQVKEMYEAVKVNTPLSKVISY